MSKPKLFLDSGAFSAKYAGAVIERPAYCEFVKAHSGLFDVVATLDVIGDAEGTLKAQEEMEAHGVRSTPCFHYGEDPKYLVHYIKNYDYIAIGGAHSSGSTAALQKWLDMLWERYLTDRDGRPVVKVHGFAMTGISTIQRYPWYSVDSTSWLMSAAMGKIMLVDPELAPQNRIVAVDVSAKSPKTSDKEQHYQTLTPASQRAIAKRVESLGFTMEQAANEYVARFEINAIAYHRISTMCRYRPFRDVNGDLFAVAKQTPKKAALPAWDHVTMYLAGSNIQICAKLIEQYGFHRLFSYHYIHKDPDWIIARDIHTKLNNRSSP